MDTDPRLWRRWDAGRWGRLTGGRLLVARGLGDIRATLPLRMSIRAPGARHPRDGPTEEEP